MASPVVSLTCAFGTLRNNITQRQCYKFQSETSFSFILRSVLRNTTESTSSACRHEAQHSPTSGIERCAVEFRRIKLLVHPTHRALRTPTKASDKVLKIYRNKLTLVI